MEVLLVYATYSGGTLHAAEIIAETLQSAGHSVTMKSVREIEPDIFSRFTHIIFGSNTWLENKEEGNMNGGYYVLKPKLSENSLSGKKCAIYGLGDSHQYNTTFCKSVDHLEQFVQDFHGELFAQSLRVDRFYFEKQNNSMKVKDWATRLAQLVA